ncbi:MAG: hypothetical protein WBW71_01380, partial [Bacteroidota bacterium]
LQSIANKHFNNKNKLTRQLMKIDRFSFGSLLLILAGIIFAIPILVVSFASWTARSGAIMQVVSSRSSDVKKNHTQKEILHA